MVCYISFLRASGILKFASQSTFFWSRDLRDLISEGSKTGIRIVPKRQSRREIMLILLWVLTMLRQTQNEMLDLIDGAIRRLVRLRDLPSARIALPPPTLLSSLTRVGQYEKNANQCNSRRRVAYGDGRRPTALRPQYRSTS